MVATAAAAAAAAGAAASYIYTLDCTADVCIVAGKGNQKTHLLEFLFSPDEGHVYFPRRSSSSPRPRPRSRRDPYLCL